MKKNIIAYVGCRIKLENQDKIKSSAVKIIKIRWSHSRWLGLTGIRPK